MFFFLACVFLLVREMPARPTEKTDSATQGTLNGIFQVVMQSPQEESGNFSSSLPCVELNGERSTVLRLANRTLASFPACMPALLEHLDLSDNLLPEFNGQDAAYLPDLQVLSLRKNKIRQVTWGAGSLSRLRSLDLSFNLLQSVPACNASSLGELKELSLAGNPMAAIHAFAFSCSPQLHILNLSSTLLGQDGNDGIQDSAFALDLLHGETSESVGNVLSVLDLSSTFLERIRPEWFKDLPRLASLHLRQMSHLRSLDAAVLAYAPQLRELDCQDSRVLSWVKTESFSQLPEMALLMFQNCNLSSLTPWNLSSLDALVINIYGNPLVCHCEMSWLLSEPERIVLQRESETTCYASPEDNLAAVSMPLSRLFDECQSNRTSHSSRQLMPANRNSTSASYITETLPDSSTFAQEWRSSVVAPQTTALTWGDVAKQDSTQTDMLAYKEETVDGAPDSPPTRATPTSASTILGKTSAEQTVGNTTEIDLRGHNPTTADSLVRPEGTLYQSALTTPTTAPTGTGSSPVPSGSLISPTVASSALTKPPMQIPTKSPALPSPKPTDIPIYYVDHYDYEDHQEESEVQTLRPCAYDPCTHLQKPCSELQELSPCLCPGISDEFTIPKPPRLRDVSEIRDTSADIHWCAPNSYVRFYQLVYRLKSSLNNETVSGEIYPTAREYTLYNLLPSSTYQVCVIASNKAGSSKIRGWNGQNSPCMSFATKPNYKSSFAVLSAVSGLLLIATILMSGCLCKKHKAPYVEQYNTHLVSYKNPAFENSSK